jgi:hypothetical protein
LFNFGKTTKANNATKITASQKVVVSVKPERKRKKIAKRKKESIKTVALVNFSFILCP